MSLSSSLKSAINQLSPFQKRSILWAYVSLYLKILLPFWLLPSKATPQFTYSHPSLETTPKEITEKFLINLPDLITTQKTNTRKTCKILHLYRPPVPVSPICLVLKTLQNKTLSPQKLPKNSINYTYHFPNLYSCCFSYLKILSLPVNLLKPYCFLHDKYTHIIHPLVSPLPKFLHLFHCIVLHTNI